MEDHKNCGLSTRSCNDTNLEEVHLIKLLEDGPLELDKVVAHHDGEEGPVVRVDPTVILYTRNCKFMGFRKLRVTGIQILRLHTYATLRVVDCARITRACERIETPQISAYTVVESFFTWATGCCCLLLVIVEEGNDVLGVRWRGLLAVTASGGELQAGVGDVDEDVLSSTCCSVAVMNRASADKQSSHRFLGVS